MIDYIEEKHGLQTIQQNFTEEQHGKGTYFHAEHFGLNWLCSQNFPLCIYVEFTTLVFVGIWDAEGGGGKTGTESAALHGFEINTAHDLYTFLQQHHSQPTNSYHEALHQVDKREFHYFPRGNFFGIPSLQVNITYVLWIICQTKNCRPKALSALKPCYTFAVRRTGLPEVKTIFQRCHFCPCAPCTTGDYHHCLYQAFLGMSHLYQAAFWVWTFTIEFLLSHLKCFHSFLGEWHKENMEI